MKHTDINPDIYIYIESLSSFGSKTFYILNRSGSDSYSFTGIAPNSIPSVSLIVFEPIPNSNDMYTKHAYMADLTFEEDD